MPRDEADLPESIRIRRLYALGDAEMRGLSSVLIDCVEGGASVSFMLPMPRAKAEAYWRSVSASVERAERMLFVAEEAHGDVVGTVQLLIDQPENQPHRADIAKMLVRRSARRNGVGAALLAAAERGAGAAGKTLLVLDTASAAAGRLYARHGWRRCGQIPGYALLPDGTPCATVIFFKTLSE